MTRWQQCQNNKTNAPTTTTMHPWQDWCTLDTNEAPTNKTDARTTIPMHPRLYRCTQTRGDAIHNKTDGPRTTPTHLLKTDAPTKTPSHGRQDRWTPQQDRCTDDNDVPATRCADSNDAETTTMWLQRWQDFWKGDRTDGINTLLMQQLLHTKENYTGQQQKMQQKTGATFHANTLLVTTIYVVM